MGWSDDFVAAVHELILAARSLSNARRAHASVAVRGALHRHLPTCAALLLTYSTLSRSDLHADALAVYNSMIRSTIPPPPPPTKPRGPSPASSTPDPSTIASTNNFPATAKFPTGHEVIVPVQCSCSGSGEFYQHNASHTIRTGDTYYLLSNINYQDLTTCQALINQNPYKPEDLPPGRDIVVPLRCGCPTSYQISSGFRYLLTYVVVQGDSIASIARRFNIDILSLLDVNPLWDGNLYSDSTVLVPLRSEPELVGSPPPPPPLPLASSPSSEGESDNKMVFIGIGIAVGFLAPLTLLLLWLMHQNRLRLRLPFRVRSIEEEDESNELPDTSFEASLSRTIYNHG